MATIPVVPSCLCCGEPTRGGDFLPGHDAKYKAHLIREALAGGNPDAVTELAARGWTKFLDKRREVEARPKGEPRPKPVANENGNVYKLLALKAGANLLRSVGRYAKGPGQIPLNYGTLASVLEFTHPGLTGMIAPDDPAAVFGWTPAQAEAVASYLAPVGGEVID